MPRRSSARQSHLGALAGHAVHSFHAKRSAAWPDLADLLLTLHRCRCRSMPPDSDAITSIYSSPRFRTPTHCTPGRRSQEPSTGAYTGRWPTSEEFASAAYSTPLQRTTSHSAASAPTALHAGLPPSSHVGAEQASSCC
eukprot:scaffold45041_cov37-Phaeocystis_antarctica.AAC.1